MDRRAFGGVLLAICVIASVVALVGCGVKPNEKAKQQIIENLHPSMKPVSDFRFSESASSGSVAFQFTGANGMSYTGTFDGEQVNVKAVQ